MPSVQERAFLRRILEHPAADGPRLIYADWLDEKGDPRGEFIRVQCALASLAPDDPRRESLAAHEHALLEAHRAEWTSTLPAWVQGYEFSRGLVEAVAVRTEGFLREGAAVFELTPIRRVRLNEAHSRMAEVAQSPLLSRIRELDLCGNDLGNGGPNILARSPYLGHLEFLDLSFNDLTNRGIESLVTLRALKNLKRLHLNDNARISTPGIRQLADSPNFANLLALDLSGNDLNESSVRTLINGTSLKKLVELRLSGNRLSDGGVQALAESELLRNLLRHSPALDLSENQIGPVGAQHLAASPVLSEVQVLDLSGNALGDAGLRSIATSRYARHLRALRVANNRLTDIGFYDLWDLVLDHSLEEIDLTGNVITAVPVAGLQDAVMAKDWRKSVAVKIDKTYLSRGGRRRG
jgi:uncharacterized protein (TIGR02996 family)